MGQNVSSRRDHSTEATRHLGKPIYVPLYFDLYYTYQVYLLQIAHRIFNRVERAALFRFGFQARYITLQVRSSTTRRCIPTAAFAPSRWLADEVLNKWLVRVALKGGPGKTMSTTKQARHCCREKKNGLVSSRRLRYRCGRLSTTTR